MMAMETHVLYSAPNEIFVALRRRRGTAADLQGPNRHQALTIIYSSVNTVWDKAGHYCDFTGCMLTSPARLGPAQ